MTLYKDKAKRMAGVVTVAAMAVIGSGFVSLAHADNAAEIEKVRAGIAKLVPDKKPDGIVASPVEGFYEVMLGSDIYYVSKDGKYLLNGKIIDIDSKQYLVSKMAEKAKAKQAIVAAAKLKELNEDDMIIFAPEDYKYTITVFTDIDCGYCRKLHKDINKYNDLGIRVRYLSFPRAGIGSPAYNKAVSVWCSEDRQKALTLAKSGKPIESKTCDNPVKDEYEVGIEMGVTGTPALYFDDGQLVPGYIPPERLLAYFKQKEGHK